MRLLTSFVLAVGVALASPGIAGADTLFASRLLGNTADQSIAGFPASRATWELERGSVALFPFGRAHAILIVRTRGLIIPALGQNPSPDLLARLVCHDAAGVPFEAARSRAVPFPASGDGELVDVIPRPSACFAPIVLLTGSRDPEGNQPGKWFATSSF